MQTVRTLYSLKVAGTWHIPGTPSEVFDVTDEQYARIKNNVEVVGAPEPVEVQGDDFLPSTFPFSEILIGAGYPTLTAVRALADPTKIKGIGKASAAKIRAALEELDG